MSDLVLVGQIIWENEFLETGEGPVNYMAKVMDRLETLREQWNLDVNNRLFGNHQNFRDIAKYCIEMEIPMERRLIEQFNKNSIGVHSITLKHQIWVHEYYVAAIKLKFSGDDN